MEQPEQLAEWIASAADDIKAIDLTKMDVRGNCSFADFIIVCEGRSQAHVRGICDRVEEALRKQGVRSNGVEGYSEGSWILMDYIDVVLHIFHPETRQYYKLEEIYKRNPAVKA